MNLAKCIYVSMRHLFDGEWQVGLSILFATTLFFTGCNKEENEKSEVRLVKKIEIFDDKGVTTITEYGYDKQNRITEIIGTAEDDTTVSSIISYSAKNTMTYGDVTYILNSDGSITSMNIGDDYKLEYTYLNGYLQTQTTHGVSSIGDGPMIRYITEHKFTWEKGNIDSVVLEASYFEEPPYSLTTTFNIEYSIENKPSKVDFGRSYIGIPRGWYGKSTLNLPSKIIAKTEGYKETILTYRYETDEEGYPVKIFETIDNGEEVLRTVIEYKN